MKSYCVKQRKQTECVEPSGTKTAKNGRLMHFCTCAECGITETRSVKNQTGQGFIEVISALPKIVWKGTKNLKM